jgi:HlyD family secretion protein
MKRWIWVFVLCAIAGGAIYWGMQPQPVPVEAATVTTGPLRVTVEEEGKTRLRDRYTITAPVGGYMGRIALKAGDPVRAGAVLTTLDPPRPAVLDARSRDIGDARVKAAEAAFTVAQSRVATQTEQIRAARADLDYWRAQRQRDEALQKSGDLPAARVERTLADLRRAEAAYSAAERELVTLKDAVNASRAEINAARAALRQTAGAATGERVPVVVPAGGRVIRVVRESEGVVNPGDPLVEVGDARAIEIVVEVLSADAVRIQPGMRVMLERWGGPKPLEARVRTIEPGGFTKISALGVEEQRVRVIADIVTRESEWNALGDGYRVEAVFILWESASTLQLPANALFRAGADWAVFAIENGVARRRVVKIGQRNGLGAEVVSGLKQGDQVITHPDETVEDGKLVKTGQ